MFIRPRAGSDVASVGAIAATGPVGMRAATRIPIFVSGVGLPDVVVFGADVWTKGVAGVRAAGFFGNDWSLETGDVAVR